MTNDEMITMDGSGGGVSVSAFRISDRGFQSSRLPARSPTPSPSSFVIRHSSFVPLLLTSVLLPISGAAQPFRLPTANVAIFEPGGEERFFVGTVGKPWLSGTFGCVRTEGWQLHEGLDIRSVERDRKGEPTDPVVAAADGTVAYFNTKPGLSNYGKYVILRHQIEGLDVYTLYAHLAEIAPGLKFGDPAPAGAIIGIMGRTSNTREGISRDRAHVHFEINLLLNERFPEWYRRTFPGQRNDHGGWNGQNLAALDPWQVLVAQKQRGAAFRLSEFIRGQTELCRVAVRVTNFPWLRRYPGLVRPNPVAEKEGAAGHEIALNYVGVPFEVIPRAASELKSKSRIHLLSVNAAEYQKRPCRKLVSNRGGRWQLANNGQHLLDLLTY